jgi:hypothetical protein
LNHTMTSLTSNYGNKRKRNDAYINIDDAQGKDEPSRLEKPMAACIDESSSELVSFLEFRRSAIHQYSSLNWLGPGVMAVYWFKEYLKSTPFDWVQCPKQNQQSVLLSSAPNHDDSEGRSDQEERRKRQKQNRLRRRKTNSKGNFYFIPGQYLRIVGQKSDTIATTKDLAIQNVLYSGTSGIHYATSYIGVYNLLRSNGRFAIKAEHNASNKVSGTEMKRLSSGLHNSMKGNPMVVPIDYIGPPLPF